MSKASAKTTRNGPTYGEAAARLEEILHQIEEGEVDIDELSGLVGEAARLVTLCREKIQAAEVQVRTITEQLERAEGVEQDAEEDLPGDEDAEREPPF
jgi:exodeoxyribonuclease VII small subunit